MNSKVIASEAKQSSELIRSLEHSGYAIVDHFLGGSVATELAEEAGHFFREGKFHPATTGKSRSASTLRSDLVCWWDQGHLTRLQTKLSAQLLALQKYLNDEFFLSLWDFECHYAIYPEGAHYGHHVDRFQSDDLRVLSFVIYLNEPPSGGELELFLGEESLIVRPTTGKLVLFLSDKIPHEVHRAHSPRYTLTGWFRRRPNLSVLR